MSEFTNLDGLTVSPASESYCEYIQSHGYPKAVQVKGEVGCTELGLHTRKYAHIGIVAFVREENVPDKSGYMSGYAYVLLNDGSFLDGCFYRFLDGSFSVS